MIKIKIMIAAKGKLLIIVIHGFKNNFTFSFNPDKTPKIKPIQKLIDKDINNERSVFDM
jgi:hypothetical protein